MPASAQEAEVSEEFLEVQESLSTEETMFPEGHSILDFSFDSRQNGLPVSRCSTRTVRKLQVEVTHV